MPEALWFFNILNTYLIFEYMRRTYGFKYDNPTFYFVLAAAFYFIHTLVNLQQMAPLNIISDIILYNIVSFRYFKPRKEKAYFNAIFQFYMLSLDLIFTGSSAAINEQKFTDWQKSPAFISWIAANFIVYILTFERAVKAFQQYYVFFDSEENINYLYKTTFFQYILTLALSVWYGFSMSANVIGILLMLAIVYKIVQRFSEFISVQRSIEQDMRTKLYEEYAFEMENVAKLETNIRESVSDICFNHIAHSRNLSEISQEEADAHIEYMQSRIGKIAEEKYSDHTIKTIMLIASEKTKEKNIKLKADIDDLDWSFIEKRDLITVLLGAIYNAVETSTGGVSIQIRTNGGHVLMVISQTCDIAQIEEGNEIIFPSPGNLLKTRTGIILSIAEKYDADVNFRIRQNIFTTSILFSTNI